MKFEFDNRTGQMRPKKDDQIYFSRSLSGGLRIDDNLNGIKYIIEKNGEFKAISGVIKSLNIYDNRNAHIISDRVRRMFGQSHTYANYKMFLKGYNGIKSYDEFVGEGFMTRSLDRKKHNDVRKEDGILVKLPNGDKVVLGDNGCGLPYQLDGDEYYYILEDFDDLVIFGYDNDGDYTYFTYCIEDGEVELNEIASSNYDMTEDDFVLIKAMYDSNITDSDDTMKFDNYSKYCNCTVNDRTEYYMFDSESNARDMAYDRVEEYVDDIFNTLGNYRSRDDYNHAKNIIDGWIDSFGDKVVDTDQLEEFQREDYESYVNDIEDEDGTCGNRLFDELIEANIIEASEDYFEADEDGELNYEEPLFDIDEKKEELVDHLCSRYDDVVEWYTDNFGGDGLDNYMDKDRIIDCILDVDGISNCLAANDDWEYENDDYTILIYEIG